MMNKLHEECGVFGVFSKNNYEIASTVYYGLYALQHRGQQSCGIVVNDDGVFTARRDLGLVNEVFNKDSLESLGEGA
ncbi:MAG: amidophosphoribosyltransferase, partial [Christensenellaceae bacterium]|nr:amidophosphoribosyltransferase [Christensenellaceae bacterium]